MLKDHIVVLLTALSLASGGFPEIPPTEGEIWPHPQMQDSKDTYMIIRPSTFNFTTKGHDCDILQEAITRYLYIMFGKSQQYKSNKKEPWSKQGRFNGYLDTVTLDLVSECETYPHSAMDEQYEIKIDTTDDPGVGIIISQSIWGILRGLESFSQLLIPNGPAFNINSTQILDFPRFSFRGLLLDTARHYLPLERIYETLELLAMNKFNVFHWHIVDDQSFPYVSDVFPDMSKMGSWSSNHVYSAKNISAVIDFARLRGIRVLPEFDTPGHTRSWGPAQPGLLTACYKDGQPDGTFGPIDPTNDANYEILTTLFTEITQRFVDHYVHLGGDEVDFSCWESNPNITDYMNQHNITGNYSMLEQVYITKLLDIVTNLPTKNGYLVWQEVFDNGVEIKNDTVVHVWKYRQTPSLYKKEMAKVTAAGFNTLLSSCWYLNDISYGDDWVKYYDCDPYDFDGTDLQKQLVIGGEACMWGEYVDGTNLISRTWPRASAVGEKLWSAFEYTSNGTTAAAPRLEEHRCRLLDRGFHAQPLTPSFCLTDIYL